jgi:hypothetical protein
MNVMRCYFFAMIALLFSVTRSEAQLPPPAVVPPVPNLNPSSSLVLPPLQQAPVSPAPGVGGSLLHHYHSVCSVFRQSQAENGEPITANEHGLDSIRDTFAALRACWLPPPNDEARHGMEYTIRFALKRDGTMIAPPRMTYSSHGVPTATRDIYREAIDEALKRCIPLHFSAGMAGAVAGRPIAIRFVDDRTIDKRQDMK